jgi:hypothetical protein
MRSTSATASSAADASSNAGAVPSASDALPALAMSVMRTVDHPAPTSAREKP